MVQDLKIAEKAATYLLNIEAVKLNVRDPFHWASGWESPIYCDNRLTLSYPHIRKFIKNSLASLIGKIFKDAEGIAGVATAGIPQGALVADKLNLPFIYVRSKAKEHGLENQIEGKAEEGMKVVVVEDLISTGGSSLKVVDTLRANQVEVAGMVSIFTYGFKQADDNFKSKKVKYYSLCDYASLIKKAAELGYVTKDQMILLKSWRTDPANWHP